MRGRKDGAVGVESTKIVQFKCQTPSQSIYPSAMLHPLILPPSPSRTWTNKMNDMINQNNNPFRVSLEICCAQRKMLWTTWIHVPPFSRSILSTPFRSLPVALLSTKLFYGLMINISDYFLGKHLHRPSRRAEWKVLRHDMQYLLSTHAKTWIPPSIDNLMQSTRYRWVVIVKFYDMQTCWGGKRDAIRHLITISLNPSFPTLNWFHLICWVNSLIPRGAHNSHSTLLTNMAQMNSDWQLTMLFSGARKKRTVLMRSTWSKKRNSKM